MTAVRITSLGDQAVVVQLGDEINEATFRRVQAVVEAFQGTRPTGFREVVSGFTTVTAYYEPLQLTYRAAQQQLESLLEDVVPGDPPTKHVAAIPVCYGGEFGPDLDFVAEHAGLSCDEAISIHCQADYLVHMIGFAPGFPYLGGMSPKISAPRRQTPRLRTPAGSVGIAGTQTGIYSLETPGGWQIIGRTPLRLFRPHANPPTLLEAGDTLRFVPISAEEYQALAEREPA